MNNLLRIHSILSFVFLLSSLSFADPLPEYDTVVEGKNDPLHDIASVQAAVNQGGKVLLTGSFDFGYETPDFTVSPPKVSAVYIENDVQIYGETNNQGEPLTIISGGFWTFFNPIPAEAFSGDKITEGPKITVKNIHFDGAVYAPLHFSHTSGLEIANTKITNVIPFGPLEIFGRANSYWQAGIYATTVFLDPRNAISDTESTVVPGAITGPLVFKDNEIDLKISKPRPQNIMGQGVFVVRSWGADISVKNNTLKNITRNAIELLDNYKAESGTITITGNEIITSKDGINVPSPSTPNGVVVGWFNDPSQGTDPEIYSKIAIADNHIRSLGSGLGIISICNETVMHRNHVVVDGKAFAAGIAQNGSYGLLTDNRIEGAGYYAFYAGGSGNTFEGNDTSAFKEAHPLFPFIIGYDIILAGDNNTVIQGGGTVFDRGQDNVIKGDYVIRYPRKE